MSHQFTVSKRGRRLIKAFEGFRPVDRTLVTGQRVVGYGHRVRRPEAVTVTRSEANALLKSDLAPYEDMINTEVHAPLNQNQFDALVSLAFSIGPKAFLESPTLHLMNNGRPLDAARSIEIWRKSRIDGKAYVVDALVRRRAQEKALFLRPVAGIVHASRVYLEAIEDSEMSGRIWDENLPVFEHDDAGYVGTVPYDVDARTEVVPEYTPSEAHPDIEPDTDDAFADEPSSVMPLRTHTRRRDDGPAGVLTLSEVIDEPYDMGEDEMDEYEQVIDIDDIVLDDTQSEPSPIAVAAAEVSDRLDALIGDDAPLGPVIDTADWPESLITADEPDESEDFTETDDDYALPAETFETTDVSDLGATAVYDSRIDETAATELRDIAEILTVKAQASEEIAEIDIAPDIEPEPEPGGLGPYLVMIVTGLTLMGASFGAMLRGGDTRLGEAMPFWSGVGLIVGAAILLFALYYIVKSILQRA